MKILKFGGPLVQDATAIKAKVSLLKNYGDEPLILVAEAFGQSKELLEKASKAAFYKESDAGAPLEAVVAFHFNLLHELMSDASHTVFAELNNCFVELEWSLEDDAGKGFEFVYDQVVSMGAVLASKVLSAYLNETGLKNTWFDIRDCIQTNNAYGNGHINEKLSRQYIEETVAELFEKENKLLITQGGLGCTSENFTTTLGPEGIQATLKVLADSLCAEVIVSY
jgi:aspartate kinase